MMNNETFWLLFATCTLAMVACRVLPAFVLRGRQLSPRFQLCLNLIAPAAFGALVASDLFNLDKLSAGTWSALMPIIAALVVFLVAYKTKSLLICAITGIVSYSILYYFVAL